LSHHLLALDVIIHILFTHRKVISR